ncbi:hypothetical protein BFW01_g7581 [Lasiodiplodia theobromae]|nr:hypothetical protein BFW01_g7581 [Lasiodiplodia theobromae]
MVLTKSKTVSMVLCLLIYLEFASAFHYNGGELIYLDRSYNCIPLLATVLFSGYFIALANTVGNSIAFAKHILVVATGASDFNDKAELVRYIAISILTVVCFLHMISNNLVLFLNKAFAYFKVILLFVVAFRGFYMRNPEALSDWSGASDFKSSMAALVPIFYAFEGWENAKYVTGEFQRMSTGNVEDKKKLRQGSFVAVFIVTALYMLATAGYFCVLTYAEIEHKERSGGDLSIVTQFAQAAFGSSAGIAICISLSAVGNLIAVIYTYSRVKQSMAIQNFLPFSNLLKRNKDHPIGGIVVHWIVTVATIIALPNDADGYGFVVGIFSYGHTIIAVFTGLGFVWISSTVDRTEWFRYVDGWQADFSWWNHWYNRVAIAFVFILLNMNVVVCAPMNLKGDADGIPRWRWPVIFFAVEGVSFIYWAILRLMDTRRFEDIMKFRLHIYTAENNPDAAEKEESRMDGSRRRAHVEQEV